MATKNKPQVFKSFEEIDLTKCRIAGNIEIVGTIPPIIDETTNQQEKETMATSKKKAAPAVDEKPVEAKPQETVQEAQKPKPAKTDATEVKEATPVESKNENKETKVEPNNKEEGKIEMKKEETAKNTETKTVETAKPAAAEQTVENLFGVDTTKQIEQLIKDGKITIEHTVKHEPFWKEGLRAAGLGAITAAAVFGTAMLFNALAGGEE